MHESAPRGRRRISVSSQCPDGTTTWSPLVDLVHHIIRKEIIARFRSTGPVDGSLMQMSEFMSRSPFIVLILVHIARIEVVFESPSIFCAYITSCHVNVIIGSIKSVGESSDMHQWIEFSRIRIGVDGSQFLLPIYQVIPSFHSSYYSILFEVVLILQQVFQCCKQNLPAFQYKYAFISSVQSDRFCLPDIFTEQIIGFIHSQIPYIEAYARMFRCLHILGRKMYFHCRHATGIKFLIDDKQISRTWKWKLVDSVFQESFFTVGPQIRTTP